jgi:hypothetical protein
MAVEKLSPEDRERFANAPEIDMGLQIGKSADGEHSVIVGGRIAITYDSKLLADMALHEEFLSRPESRALENYGERLLGWVRALGQSEPLRPVPLEEALSVLGFIHLGPRHPFGAPPWRPPGVYGHLPFRGVCSSKEVFYRYEQFPTSVRIDQANRKIVKPDTYAAPRSERRFTPTGLSAVARFALPSLLPACWRWKITPVSGTRMYYGASVPLYGQSGGGVEVSFPDPFNNDGPIPNPTVLPIF